MNRKASSSMGAFHPVLFMLMVYAISVVLAFFVCNTIYNSLNKSSLHAQETPAPAESLVVLK